VEFEPTTPVFERTKTVHVLDRTVTVSGKSPIFWDITPCNQLKLSRRFGGTCRLHLCWPPAFTLVFYLAYSSVLKMAGTRSPKHPLAFNGLQGVIWKKIEFFITTDVRTSNPTFIIVFTRSHCHATTQAVSNRIPIAADRVRTQVWLYEIYVGQIGTRAGYLRVLQFSITLFITPNCSI
jgi:hypothetical protein